MEKCKHVVLTMQQEFEIISTLYTYIYIYIYIYLSRQTILNNRLTRIKIMLYRNGLIGNSKAYPSPA